MRLPAHLEASSLIRLTESQGGMATVLAKGERDAGTILIVTMYRGESARLYERMPQRDGTRTYVMSKIQDTEKPEEFFDYLTRRQVQDPDIWVVEVDIADSERLIALLPD
jgi:hypothetical protein